MVEYSLNKDSEGKLYLTRYEQVHYISLREQGQRPTWPFEAWAEMHPELVIDKEKERVWQIEEKTFEGLPAALNYLINQQWEKNCRGFTIRKSEPEKGRLPLPVDDQDLVKRLRDAYDMLEKAHRAVGYCSK